MFIFGVLGPGNPIWWGMFFAMVSAQLSSLTVMGFFVARIMRRRLECKEDESKQFLQEINMG